MVRINLMEDKAVFGGDDFEKLRKIWMLRETREFVVADVVTIFEVQTRTVRRWIDRWCDAGLLRCTKEATGTTPANYVITKVGKAALSLPESKVVAA